MGQELTTIRLYGVAGVRFGRVHRLAVGSAHEAVRALCA
ncbi:tail assembly protein, partial [Burkholderia sp. SIMBA_048]